MRFTCALVLTALVALPGAGPAAGDAPAGVHSCRFCHEDEAGQEKVSIHLAKGVSCEACHGGDPRQPGETSAMDPARGYRGKLTAGAATNVCSTCHMDKKGVPGPAAAYGKSVHARNALGPGPRAGPLCTDCHGIHDIRARSDPQSPVHRSRVPALCDRCHGDPERMNPFGLPVDQLAKYRSSHHGRAVLRDGKLAAAVCTDCHGAHEIVSPRDPTSPTHPSRIPATCGRCHADSVVMKAAGLASTAVEDYRAGVHGQALLRKGAASAPSCVSCHGSHSAVPPGIRSVAMVCGTCHPRNQDAVARSPHTGPKFRGCVECHGNHKVERPTAALFDSACVRCHADGTPGAALGARVRDMLVASDTRMAALRARVKRVAALGHSTKRLQALVQRAEEVLLEVRPELHAMRPEGVDQVEKRVRAALSDVDGEVDAKEERARRIRLSLLLVTSLFLLVAWVFHRLVREYDRDVE